jgi:hypothetical protein
LAVSARLDLYDAIKPGAIVYVSGYTAAVDGQDYPVSSGPFAPVKEGEYILLPGSTWMYVPPGIAHSQG